MTGAPSRSARLGLGLMLCTSLLSCSHIDENEQLIYVKPPEISRCVLIEDFTGQRCVNCPNATQAIADLQNAYGHDAVVAVAIYSGPFGSSSRGVRYALTTETGDEYFNYWGLDSQPVGMVNRRTPSDYADWGTQVHEDMSNPARVEIESPVSYDAETRKAVITVVTAGANGVVDGKLQVWLTEDNITAFQYMPDGTTNQTYTHNHVFRDAVNGTWGTDFHIVEGEIRLDEFSYTIPEDKDWNPAAMSVVTFVYNGQGVEQAHVRPLIYTGE